MAYTYAVFRHVEAAMFRGAWDRPDAPCIAMKAGDNRANHSYLDIGGFVLEAGGERFAIDLGPDDYSLPGYSDPRTRFGYYRLAGPSAEPAQCSATLHARVLAPAGAVFTTESARRPPPEASNDGVSVLRMDFAGGALAGWAG